MLSPDFVIADVTPCVLQVHYKSGTTKKMGKTPMTINDLPFFRLILGYPHAQILENMFKGTDVHR